MASRENLFLYEAVIELFRQVQTVYKGEYETYKANNFYEDIVSERLPDFRVRKFKLGKLEGKLGLEHKTERGWEVDFRIKPVDYENRVLKDEDLAHAVKRTLGEGSANSS